jgi:hypothetical protein
MPGSLRGWPGMPDDLHFPPRRQHAAHFGSCKPVVDEIEHAPVRLSSNHPPRGLYDFLQPGIEIRVVIPGAELPVHARFHLLVDRIELRQPKRGDERADQPRAAQVYAFTE